MAELGSALAARGVELVSTGGTAKALRDAGLTVRDVSDLTGFPEMMDGRVKTLHPTVHGGLLALRDNPEHVAAMEAHGIGAIDLVVVNLYPFEATVAKGADRAEIIENIDIGGPSMVRSAAKNHGFVTILTDPADYPALLEELAAGDGATSQAFRIRMAGKAYARTASYDAAIANWFAFGDAFTHPLGAEALHATPFVETMPLAFKRADVLRYGENPHQSAAIYVPQVIGARGVPQAVQLQGKELSYNNLNDADAALELAAEFAGQSPAVVIVKHANPCGVAQSGSLLAAWEAALACDSVSAFGGIVAVNTELDAATAEAISAIFTEVVIAPSVSAEAREIFAKKKNLRLLECGALPDPRRGGFAMKTIAGGMLIQSRDAGAVSLDDLQGRHQTRSHRAGTAGLPVRLDSGSPRQIQRYRLCQGRGDRRDWRGPDEPPRFCPDRRDQGQGSRRNPRLGRTAHCRQRGRFGRVFPLCRRVDFRCRSRRDGGDPTGRIDPR